jgi:hypothetical protein
VHGTHSKARCFAGLQHSQTIEKSVLHIVAIADNVKNVENVMNVENVEIVDMRHRHGRLACIMSSQIDSSRVSGLCSAVRNLSLPGKEALAILPAGRHRADALAISFDDHYTSFMERMTGLPGEAQLIALQELDSALNAISGPDNVELWTDTSFASDPQWNDIRALAQKVLSEFGW